MKGYIFTDQLQHHAKRLAHHPMVIEGNTIYTYNDCYIHALGLANNLHHHGIGTGDYVAIVMESSSDYLVLLWALSMVGCALFPVAINRPPKEINAILHSMPFKAIIATNDVLPIKFKHTIWFDDINNRADTLTFTPPVLSDTDPVLCFQSSGSTGTAKTYIHTRQQFEHALQQYKQHYRWTEDDRLYLPMPLNDTVGCFDALAASVSATTLILASRQLSVSELITEINDSKATYFQAMPWQIRHLLHHLDTLQGISIKVLLGGKLFPHLKEIHVSTEYFSDEEKQWARKRLCKHVYEDYGCSELWIIAKETSQHHHYPESVGKIVDDLSVEIVDDNDEIIPNGEVGNIRFKANYLNDSYYNNRKLSQRHFKHGWFYPGDKASINDENYLFLHGRADDIISIKGAKYYPSEIERFLLNYKSIKEVAVFSWPTYQGDNASVAVVKREKSLTHEAIIDYCHQHLPAYKVPGLVILMNTLPKTRTGKIAKRVIKDELQKKTHFCGQ